MNYETIPVRVTAWQAPAELTINGFKAQAGEWIVTTSAGQVAIYTDKEFKDKYRVVHVCQHLSWRDQSWPVNPPNGQTWELVNTTGTATYSTK